MKYCIFFVATVLISYIANAQWLQCPLSGGNISSLAVSGTKVFAGMIGPCIFKSEDYGSSWIISNNGMPINTKAISISIRGTEIYAGLSNNGMYKSSDNGASWNPINTGLPSIGTSPNTILFKGTYIFMSMSIGYWGVYLSADSGNNWSPVNNGIADTAINCMVNDSTGIYAGSKFFGGIYKTIDDGATWFPVNTGLPTGYLTIWSMVVRDSVIYAGISSQNNGDEIYKSSDHGATWNFCSGFSTYIKELAVCDDKIYAGTENGIYYSTDGISWLTINTGLSNNNINSLTVNGLDIFAGTRGGVFFLAHDSTKWVSINNGICGFTFNSIEGSGNHLFAAERLTGVYMTTDYGDTWTTKNNGLTDLQIPVLASNGNYIFAGNSYGLYRSQNYGNSWTFLNTGMPPSYSPSSVLAYGSNVLLGYYEGLYKSTDNGTTWTTANGGLPSSPWVKSLASNSSNEVFAAVSDVGVYMSTDNGANWTNISNGAGGIGYVNTLATSGAFIMAGLDYWNPPVIATNDYGSNWLVGSNGLFGQTINSLKTIGDCVFAATSGGVFFTKNNGTDWIDMSQGLPAASSVTCIGRDDSCIYAGVYGNGIWKRPISDFGIDFVEIHINEFLTDPRIFPNPAGEILFIETDEKATVEIINMQGQIVETHTLTDKTSTVDVTGLSRGIYSLRIKTEKGIAVRKLIKQ